MGVTNAMNTSKTGLDTSQIKLETIGDNIANVNTTAFKSNRADFENLLAITLRDAVPPGPGTGGLNPSQVGLGAGLAAIQRSFLQGAISPTGVPSNLAIEGHGFFIVEDQNQTQYYTRDGSFTLNADSELVTSSGLNVLGFPADDEGEISTTGQPSALSIPLGVLTQVRATTTAEFVGNLNSSYAIATAPTVQTSLPLSTSAGTATENTALTSLVDLNGLPIIADGDVIELSNTSKGGFVLAPQQFVVGVDGSTVADLMQFMEGALAINTDTALGANAGVTLASGAVQVISNLGEPNAIELNSASLVNMTSGSTVMSFDPPTPAAGEGVTTSFDAYDSLGNEVSIRLRIIKIDSSDASTTWRWYAESPDDTDVSNVIGTGTLVFDQNGNFSAVTGNDLTIDLSGSGAVNPLALALDFSAMTGLADGSGTSEIQLSEQDGRPFGTLESFAIDEDGVITGAFDNGLTSTLGQVALATFTNPNGLKLVMGNSYVTTGNSGEPMITVPKEGHAGRLEAGALELSNVDLAREFIGLIQASTAFSANSRVITTADELLQELLLIAR